MTCHKRFVKEEWFNNHMQEVHSNQNKKRKADGQKVDLNTIPRPEKSLKSNQFKCNFCTQTFSKKYNAERHTKRNNGKIKVHSMFKIYVANKYPPKL